LRMRNKRTERGSGGGLILGDNSGMEFLGLEGIWSGGGREDGRGAEIIVGFNKMLEFGASVCGLEGWAWNCRSFDSSLVGDKTGWVVR
jgi:hypothetical protein